MIDPHKTKVVTNLKKAQGQMAHVLKMIEEEAYCLDIATQINAALGLLKKANSHVLESHLTTCGARHLTQKDPEKKASFIKELVRVFSVTNR